METKPPVPLTTMRVQWIDAPPNPRRRMDVLGYADAEGISYQIIRVPVPQPIEFGRATWMDEARADAIDRERIQEPPIGPQKPRPWRSLGIALALLPVVIVALVLLVIHGGVIWFAERIRLIVTGMA